MNDSRLEPLEMLSNDITRIIFLDILFSCSKSKQLLFFIPSPSPGMIFNVRKDNIRKQPSGICKLENLPSHSLSPRINFFLNLYRLRSFPCVFF